MTDIDWENMPEWADVWVEPKHEDEIGKGWHRDDGDRWKKKSGQYWMKKDVGKFFDVHYPPKTTLSVTGISVTDANYTEWSGPEDGYPPVGTVCKGYLKGEWLRCEILKWRTNDAGMKVAACDFGDNGLTWSADFLPIPSQRDEWLGKAREAFITAKVGSYTSYEEEAIGVIYDALLSGDLPVPRG